jgi:uncharacterized protein YdiU (UPF0061 family)
MALKYLPVSKLESLIKNDLPVYIVNSAVLPSGDKGVIVITFYQGNRREPFKVPPTYIPIRVTDAIPSKMVLESRDFKQLLTKGLLTLVDPESAERYLNTEEAQEEYEALMLSEHSARYQQVELESSVSKRSRISHSSNADGSIGPRQDFGAADTVSNKVRGLVESLVSGTMTGKDVLMTLKRHQSALSDIDLSFIASNVQETEIKRWVKKVSSEAKHPALATHQPIKEEKAPPKRRGRSRKSEEVFSFEDEDEEMTPEERAADAAAKSRAMSEQDVYGTGTDINKEIDRVLRG